MGKPGDHDKTHLRNMAVVQARIDRIFRKAAEEAAKIGVSIKAPLPEDAIFSFDDYPQTKKQVAALMDAMKESMEVTIADGVRQEWKLSNSKNDALVSDLFGEALERMSDEQRERYFTNNADALEAFLARKTQGLNLSDRVWKYTTAFKREIELGLDLGIRSGRDADAMSRDLRDYLKYPDKLFRRVRDKHGLLRLSQAAKDFHPGQGVYRSSYKNARRLAATETNIAYRTNDHLRWQQMDFVVGIEIQLSNNHTILLQPGERTDDKSQQRADGSPKANAVRPLTDICDTLAGRYPKDFKFTGWHPNCRCRAITILKTEDEMARDTERILAGEQPTQDSVNTVTEPPKSFNEWIDNNRERAKGWSNMPYFVKDNPQYVEGFEVDIYSPEERKFTRARSTSAAMDESLGIYLSSRYPEIPNTEKAALFHYTRGDTSAYRRLNKELRKGELSEFNQAFSSLLSKALDKIEPVQETVYRTVRLNRTNLRAWVYQANSQAETTFGGFTSTSLERSIIENMIQAKSEGRKKNESDILLVIQSKSGHPIQDFSQFGGRFDGKANQREVLFDKGCRFRFDRVVQEGDRFVFYLSEV